MPISEVPEQGMLLLAEGHCLREQALQYCGSALVDSTVESTSLSTLAQMVAGGLGVTFLPSIAVGQENPHGRLVLRRLDPEPHRTVALVWRPTSTIGRGLRSLARTMGKSLSEVLSQN